MRGIFFFFLISRAAERRRGNVEEIIQSLTHRLRYRTRPFVSSESHSPAFYVEGFGTSTDYLLIVSWILWEEFPLLLLSSKTFCLNSEITCCPGSCLGFTILVDCSFFRFFINLFPFWVRSWSYRIICYSCCSSKCDKLRECRYDHDLTRIRSEREKIDPWKKEAEEHFDHLEEIKDQK